MWSQKLARTIALSLSALTCNACVVLLSDHAESPPAEAQPLVESINVDGLVMTVRRIDAVAITNSVSRASGYGSGSFSGYTPYGSYSGRSTAYASATGSSTSRTSIIGSHESHALLGLAKHHLENQHAARLVNAGGTPDVLLHGAVETTESSGALWSAPMNVIFFFGLILPQTWGEDFSVSIRAYAPDGEFLKQYNATARARTLHHWAWWSRFDAAEERKVAGLTVATMRALDAVIADLRAGALTRRQ